mgnify:CR=1 FL=1
MFRINQLTAGRGVIEWRQARPRSVVSAEVGGPYYPSDQRSVSLSISDSENVNPYPSLKSRDHTPLVDQPGGVYDALHSNLPTIGQRPHDKYHSNRNFEAPLPVPRTQ